MTLTYRIDEEDRIVSWNDHWASFARDNDAAELADRQMVTRSLWDFIQCKNTAFFYSKLISRARSGSPVQFEFRCDGPSTRRTLSMSIAHCGEGMIEFNISSQQVVDRERQPLLDRRAERDNDVVYSCSWCNRIRVAPETWHEIEEAVALLGLFDRERLPQLSHGMCDHCYDRMAGAAGAKPNHQDSTINEPTN